MAFANMASEEYVDNKFGDKQVCLTDSSGQFFVPLRKVSGVQQYMKFTASYEQETGHYTPDLDDKWYTRGEDGTFTEVTGA